MRHTGYAGTILRVDLSSGTITRIPTAEYAERFLGGRGIAAKVHWDEVPPESGAFDPQNRLTFFTGPMAGVSGIGGNRWTVCGKSPITIPEQFSYCSLGGKWGIVLKFAGYDGIMVQGRSEKPVFLSIQDGQVELRDAASLWGKTTVEVRDLFKEQLGKSAAVVACGPAGENLVRFATLLADDDASGSGGFGAVMGSKKLKAIVVRSSGKIAPANPERLQEITRYVRELKKGSKGETMDLITAGRNKKDVCFGCLGPCSRATYQAKDGTVGKFVCDSAAFYQERARSYYGEWNEVPFFANRLCDYYGVDTTAIFTMIMWLSRCSKAGIVNDETLGIPMSELGSMEFIDTLIKNIAFRKGFGDTLAEGLFRAADRVGPASKEMITDYVSKEGHSWTYCPRIFISTGLLYAIEPRHPVQQIHEIGTLLFNWVAWVKGKEGATLSSEVYRNIAKRFWGSELAVDMSTYEGKALADKIIQERQYAKECMILCDWFWPIRYVPFSEDHVGDPTLESKLLSAVVGKEVSEQELYRVGERVLNLQRAILAREGHKGRQSDVLPEPYYTRPIKSSWANPDCLAPGKDGEIISKKGAVVDREKFEIMKGEFYALRGWDVPTGLQTRARLEEVGLKDIIEDLARRNLVV